ncbi:hypothetical protein BOX15_Mlig011787g2 [Macrostomum lignano]|uniref:Alpha-1,4-N-acetylglucosaminyltransferase n=1 Tax=Macrostomum lignano TaxID=282301 RepID=A0A267G3I7_9PLAT|nr:hypothetical protein BOX15_Mlig011787g1 [Macrostomum lignano]PAA79524.1 hypothetical protein BOX15_Mlig011787g3 [Macrostomum lignano]PAA80576.1 hypothetical protein BOX15_Mlig011787g2 [Macrostomum lignano]
MKRCPGPARRHLNRMRIRSPKLRLALGLPALLLTLMIASHLAHRLAKELEFFPAIPMLPLHSTGASASGRGIPPSFVHQSWKSASLPNRFSVWSASWRRCFPDWQHRLWTDADNADFVRRKFPDFYPTWRSLPTKIERVDSVRYLYLYSMGGLYADLDSECLHPFHHLLANCSVVLGSMSVGSGWTAWRMPSGLVQNSLMYSRPGQQIWLDAIQEVQRIASQRRWSLLTGSYPLEEDRTGPLMLMRLLKRNWASYSGSVCLYRPEFFNPFSWFGSDPACRTLNGMTADELETCRRRYNSSYAIQYHTQVWRHGKSNMARAS